MTSANAHNDIQSSRLLRLQTDMRDDASAVLRFWDEMAERGTPLIEPISGMDHQMLVTFLSRAGDAVEHVALICDLTGYDPPQTLMQRMPNTDLRYKSLVVRDDLRCSYRLSPNDSLVPVAQVTDWFARSATFRTDPLNLRRIDWLMDLDTPNELGWCYSICALPNAPPQPWVQPRPEIAKGTVGKHPLQSGSLGAEMQIWVYTPPHFFMEGEPYRTLVLFDAEAYNGQLVDVPTTLDNLLADGLIPPVVALFVDNPDRMRLLRCHAPFVSYLTMELLPWARATFHLSADPAHTIIGGSSLGGLAAAHAALLHPEVFGNVLAQAGAFCWWDEEGEIAHGWLPRQFAATSTLPIRFYLDIGLLETDAPPFGGATGLECTRGMRDTLRAKGYTVAYQEFMGGHDYACWQGTIADGIMALIGHVPQ